MEAQEIFDHVVTHLRRQGRQSIYLDEDGGGSCLYRAPNGDRCAAGCLIPDEVYSPDMESKKFKRVFTEYSKQLANLEPHLELIQELQDIHDGSHLIEDNPFSWEEKISEIVPSWEERFQNLTRVYNLIYTPPING